MFFDEVYSDKFDPHNVRGKTFSFAIAIGTTLQTGLSAKIMSNCQ